MWFNGNEYIEEPQEDIRKEIRLDSKFTESARKSVQGGIHANFVNKSSKSNSIIITTVIGVGIALYFKKSPITFGIIGSLIGILISNNEK